MGREAWRHATLGEVADEVTVGHVGPMASEYLESGVPFLRSLNIEPFRISLKDIKHISPEFHARLSKSALRPGDVVIVRTGKPGVAAVIPTELGEANCSDLVIVRPGRGLDSRYLCYFVNGVAQYHVDAHLVGAVQQHFNVGSAKQLPLRLPPLREQQAIARTLGSLDDKIELNRKMNETLEAMARALFKSWFVDFDPVRAKAEGRQPAGIDPETARLFPSTFVDSELGPIPSSWRQATVGEFVELERGTTYKSALKGLPGPVLLGLGSIERNGGFRDDKLMTYGGESPDRLLLEPGDLFVSLKDVTQSADLLGAVARVPSHVPSGRLTQDTVKLVPRRNSEPVGEIIYRTLLSAPYREYCRQRATGTTNLGLSRDDFLGYPVVLAPNELLSRFNSFVGAIVARQESNSRESRTLVQLRDALLPKLLSGELSVRALESEVAAAV